jgi:hypothetical protein
MNSCNELWCYVLNVWRDDFFGVHYCCDVIPTGLRGISGIRQKDLGFGMLENMYLWIYLVLQKPDGLVQFCIYAMGHLTITNWRHLRSIHMKPPRNPMWAL